MALTVTRWVGSPQSIIAHTIIFILSFALAWASVVSWDRMLLVLTTLVSLEAIYLAIFIQMTINFQGEVIAEVESDIDEIQEDVEGISEDIEEIQEDVDELQEDVEEISEDIEEDESEEVKEEKRKLEQKETLATIQHDLQKLLVDLEKLKGVQK